LMSQHMAVFPQPSALCALSVQRATNLEDLAA
jgi:hypothetical protein